MTHRGSKILRRTCARHLVIIFTCAVDSMIHAHAICHGRLVRGYRMAM